MELVNAITPSRLTYPPLYPSKQNSLCDPFRTIEAKQSNRDLPNFCQRLNDVSTNPGNDRPIDRGEDEIAGPVRR